MKGRAKRAALALAVLATAVLVAATTLGGRASAGPTRAVAATTGCQLGDKGKIKHVIYLQFDNTHFLRDNANVPSDLEQMPHLLNFLKDNGTLLTNDHTVLISHTGTGILTSLTGVYPDRHGQAVSNTYRYYRSDGNTNTGVSFGYWTSQVPTTRPFPLPPVLSPENTTFNMLSGPVSASAPFGVNAPAPWVPYTRAGCDVGSVAAANTILENIGIDISAVFGSGSSQASEATTDPGQAQSDYVGFGVHCAQGSAACSAAKGGQPDQLPWEPGGYSGFNGLFGARYVNALLAGVAPTAYPAPNVPFNDLGNNPVVDSAGRLGFPGFDGMYASTTLSYIAAMQEKGIPVTFGYISDAHDNHGNSGDIHISYGPGQPGYVAQLQAYDQAFDRFFTRLKHDGITKDNTLFIVTVDEGDHFVGSTPTPAGCDGLTTPCSYANIGEVNGNLAGLLATEQGITTPFTIHSDVAPTIHIRNNPSRTDPVTRAFGRGVADLTAINPYTGRNDSLTEGLADSVTMKTLHMVTADPKRTPTLTMFADPNYFFFAGAASCPGGNPNNCVFIPTQAPPSTQTFAWNHGSIAPEIAQSWLGVVGPGVKKKGIDPEIWTDHTDARPTILTVLGLKDDYSLQGRTITEILNDGSLPQSLREHRGTIERLGEIYKQINAPFGQLGQDTLDASTAAIESGSPAADTFYNSIEGDIQSLTSDRDALALQIEAALNNAQFNGQAIDENQAKAWIDQGQSLLDRAHDLAATGERHKKLRKIEHFVVIYEENHSFDNLYGGWEGVNGLSNADPGHTTQVGQDLLRTPFACLQQNDVNLKAPILTAPLAADACSTNPALFSNKPFTIDNYIAPTDLTCPPSAGVAFTHPNGWPKDPANPDHGAPGGCTRDLVHRFYHEQYQLDGGRQDRYMSGSDAIGLTMGVYDTRALPIYHYLHGKDHPKYAIEDNFFQAAFGGSFLNHQWLIAAATPVDPSGAPGGANAGRHPTLDANGMPSAEPLYVPTTPLPPDQPLTATCAQVASLPPPASGLACGNYAVNTMQPSAPPSGAFGAKVPLQTAPTIGDRLTTAGVDWAWYSGGWNAAVAGTADPLFQFHHQPFVYFGGYVPGTEGRTHLKDELDFQAAVAGSASVCNLKPVSFVKPIGQQNEHPGYASEPDGSSHLVDLVSSVENSACAKDTMVIVAYDEFGGQWDHVSPPGLGGPAGPHDEWGPGTRIPALVISPGLRDDFVVDSAEHDTTSILATLEHRYGLEPLSSRDRQVNDLSTVFDAKKAK